MVRRLFTVLFALLFMTNATSALAVICENVSTAQGPVTGILNEGPGVCSFLGIPFAAPPIGELRFQLPVAHESWTETFMADTIGNQCPQEKGPMTDTSIPMNEDCLYLNVWTGADAGDKKPVMVFIHGGGFVVGSGGNATYNGMALSKYGDVIVVTMNYRLGVLGFMAHPAFSNEDGPITNRGLYDQRAALQWVKENISNFGGDPDNVTLFGQSAGGMSVGYQLVSPLSEGLFNNVSIHSGPPILLNVDTEWAIREGLDMAARAGCDNPDTARDCLLAITPEKFIELIPAGVFIMDDISADKKYFFQPVIDGKFLPDAPYKLLRDGNFNTDVHVMLGSTKDESSYFILNKTLDTDEDFMRNYAADTNGVEYIFGLDLDRESDGLAQIYAPSGYDSVKDAYADFICDTGFTCPIEIMAELISKYQPNVYRFYHKKAPFKIVSWGAFHGAELPYIFNNFKFMNQDFKKRDGNNTLSRKMIALWSTFARTGSPQVDKLPEWPEYNADTREYMVMDDEIVVESGLKSSECATVKKLVESNF